jgi:hypothetical protein
MGLLCKSGFASMGDMLSLDGPWDMDLIETMLPVAMELQADEASMHYGAHAAVQSKESSRAFRSGLDRIREQARNAMSRSRGIDNPDTRIAESADKMLILARKLKLRQTSAKGKGKGSKPSPTPTRKHGGK